MSNLISNKTRLTGRERMTRMFERRDQDRVPRHDTFWNDTIRRWRTEGLEGDENTVVDMLDGDLRPICFSDPAPFPGRWERVREDEQTVTVRDRFGATLRQWKGRSGTPEHVSFECDSRQKWEEVFKPAMWKAGVQMDFPEVARLDRIGAQAGRWRTLVCLEPFEGARRVMGDEITLMAMALEPEWIRDFAITYTDLVLRDLDAVMATGAHSDGLWIFGDMAFNHATMCSPAMYRELIWPEHRRLADWAHARGMKVTFHTDGNVNGVVDLYLQAGFDCLHPLEAKAGMDIRTLGPRYGSRLALFGNVDVMKMMTNDRDMIQEEFRVKLAAGKATKGYIYHSDHSVPPQVTWQTYQFIMSLVERYGRYD